MFKQNTPHKFPLLLLVFKITQDRDDTAICRAIWSIKEKNLNNNESKMNSIERKGTTEQTCV